MTQISLQNNPKQKIYCHIDFVKPGRQNYCISHHEAEPAMHAKHINFYVHDMLAHVRDEFIPCFVEDANGALQPVFDDLTVETASVVAKTEESKIDGQSSFKPPGSQIKSEE